MIQSNIKKFLQVGIKIKTVILDLKWNSKLYNRLRAFHSVFHSMSSLLFWRLLLKLLMLLMNWARKEYWEGQN